MEPEGRPPEAPPRPAPVARQGPPWTDWPPVAQVTLTLGCLAAGAVLLLAGLLAAVLIWDAGRSDPAQPAGAHASARTSPNSWGSFTHDAPASRLR